MGYKNIDDVTDELLKNRINTSMQKNLDDILQMADRRKNIAKRKLLARKLSRNALLNKDIQVR